MLRMEISSMMWHHLGARGELGASGGGGGSALQSCSWSLHASPSSRTPLKSTPQAQLVGQLSCERLSGWSDSGLTGGLRLVSLLASATRNTTQALSAMSRSSVVP